MQNEIIVGIDTSAYTTSMAAVGRDGTLLFDRKQLLDVPMGTRGLRQSDARTQHHKNLPDLYVELCGVVPENQIRGVAVSNRPRPVEGSYMPVFMDGVEFAAKLANRLNVPLFYFSHQEGHIEAVQHFTPPQNPDSVLSFHLSGGTSELLVSENGNIRIIGGSKDISFGQLIDRVGVALGMAFPAGAQMDQLANGRAVESEWLKPIPVTELWFNLSGIETQCQRRIQEGVPREELVPELFYKISKCLAKVCDKACRQFNLSEIIMVGGVSASVTVREYLTRNMKYGKCLFGTYSSDNAVGTALLGGKRLWG
jgi:N6-L-threonylcarbamoyladenine synthase